MNKTYKLSIITINYNNEIGLSKTIDSINNQSYNDFEFVVVDGGSKDNSLQLIKEASRINYWISEKDTGVYNAMNKGIKVSNGEYVIFMNSGDVFYANDIIEKIIFYLDGNLDIVFGNTLYYNDEGYKREEIPPAKLSFSYLKNYGINHQSVFIKRKLFYDIQFYNEDYKICSDWEFFMIAICLRNAKYKYVNEFICNYDFSGISANPNNLGLYYGEKEVTLKKYFNLFSQEIKFSNEFQSKRIKQVLYIKKNKKISWRLLKWFMDILLLFTNKKSI